jgi:hypothetical protein
MSSRWHMNPITSVLSMYQTPPGVVRGVSWVRVSTISHSLLARCCLWQKTQLERELELATTTTSSANDEQGRQPGQGRAAAVVKNGITPASKGAGNRWGYTAQIPGDQFSYSPHKGALATAAYRKQNKGAGFRVCRKAARGTTVQVPPPPPTSGLGLSVGGPSLVHAFMPPTLRGTYPPALAGPAPPLCWLGTPDSKPGIGYGPFEGRGERAASSREWLAAPPPPYPATTAGSNGTTCPEPTRQRRQAEEKAVPLEQVRQYSADAAKPPQARVALGSSWAHEPRRDIQVRLGLSFFSVKKRR